MPFLSTLRRPPLSYGVALLVCWVALLLKLVFAPLIGGVTPFLLFFAAIILSAWNGGRGPGIVATTLSTLLASYYFLPSDNIWHLDPLTGARAILFFVEGLLVALITAQLRSYSHRLREQIRRQMALAQISNAALREAQREALFETTLDAVQNALETTHATLLQIQTPSANSEIENPESAKIEGAQNHSAGENPAAVLVVRAARGWKNLQVGETLPGSPQNQLGASLHDGEAIAVADVQAETRFQIPPPIESEVRSCLVSPVGFGARAWGVLAVHHAQKRAWSAEDAEFLAAAANTLAVALERQEAQGRLAEGEARYRTFLEQSSEAIWRFELETPLPLSLSVDEALPLMWERAFLAECNEVFARMYGLESPSEVIGAPLSQFLPPDDPQNIAYLSLAWKSRCRLSDVESNEVDKDGQPRVFLNSLVGIIENDCVVRVWGTQRDVTQERKAQELISQSERRFRALFEASPVPIAIVRNGTILFVNRALVDMMGYVSPTEFAGKPGASFLPGELRPLVTQRIAARARGEELPRSYELEAVRRDGSRVPVRIEIAQLELPDGPATMAFAFDLTEDRAAGAEIAASIKRERRAALRAIRLQEFSQALSTPRPLREIADVAISRAIDALGASAGVILVPDDGCQNLSILAHQGYPADAINPMQLYPIDDSYPVTASFASAQPFWMSDIEQWAQRFPRLMDVRQLTGTRAVASIPLQVEGKTAGVLGLSFSQTRQFDEEQRAFLTTLAGLIGGALERARLDQNARESARKQQESLALLNALLESAPVGFALFDRQGRYILLNDALAQMNELSVAQHIGKTPQELGMPLEVDPAMILEAVWENGRPSGEIDIIGGTQPDQRHFLASFFPVRVEGGRMLGVGAAVLEITERVRAQNERALLFAQLETERARFEATLQQMPSAVVIAEAPSGRMILGNPQVERVLGRSFFAAQNLGEYADYKGFTADGKPLSPEEWPLARALQNGEIVEGEELLVTHDNGGHKVIRVNAAPIRDKENRITAGVVIFDDITARARQNAAQEFLAQASAALISTLGEREIFERLAELCVPRVADWCLLAVPGDDGLLHSAAITHANALQAPIAQEFQSRLAADPQLPWDIEGAMHGQKAVLYPSHSIEHLKQIHASDDYVRLIEAIGAQGAIVAPLVARGRVVGVMIWITAESGRVYDETDLALADELAKRAALGADNARLLHEAQLARDEAQTANRAKDEFLAVVSHELRTPLTPIMGWLDILRAGGNDETIQTQAYNVIERNARAQAQLIDDILDVSRITTGKLRLELKPQPLAPLVERAVESLKPVALEKRLTLETQIEDVGQVRADAARLQQIVWNLLSNALKFTPPGGLIRVSLGLSETGEAQISIQDSGVGIAPEFLPQVFERFKQADSSSTRKTGGLGLGLAIVRHIVELHDGQVSATSPGVGQGATFSLTLPVVEVNGAGAGTGQNEQKLEPPAPAPRPKLLEGFKILLVDDERDTRNTLALLLQNAGAKVEVAESGARALELAPSFEPHLVISDIGMPEMDGFELRGHLRRLLPGVPALALTAYATQSDAQKAYDAGFQKHLSKPVGIEELTTAVLELV